MQRRDDCHSAITLNGRAPMLRRIGSRTVRLNGRIGEMKAGGCGYPQKTRPTKKDSIMYGVNYHGLLISNLRIGSGFLLSLCGVIALSAAVAHGATGDSVEVTTTCPSGKVGLFGVEIGGPEDGFSLTDRAAFESAKRVGAEFIDLRPIWSTLEHQPGMYDWSTLDAGFEHAASVDLPVTVTMRFFEQQIPAWLAHENMLDQDGKGFFGYGGENSRSLSYWGPDARRSYLRLVEALVKRYRDNPSMLAWQFFYGYNDSFYLGMWGNRNTVYDYSTFSQEKYRYYLSDIKKFSLDDLNERYASQHSSWKEVTQPMPAFGMLNVSRAWHDFQDYRMWSISQMFDEIDRTVRRLDQRPLIMYFGGSLHHSAHQLTVYDIGLPLLQKYGGGLDITCFEDPVPAEIGAGIVRCYGIPLMAEAWQVPPPLKDFRRLFFHAFSLGVKSYQMVGNWEKMEISSEEFQQTGKVFLEMVGAEPVRAPIAGLISYRSILSHIPARSYINPTLAMIPKLQEHQYSLDWRSDFTPLQEIGRYPALLDANSEVMSGSLIDALVHFVEQGGRLVLLDRSGRYALEDGEPNYPLLEKLRCPEGQSLGVQDWPFGKGYVRRVSGEMNWNSEEGVNALVELMEWLKVQRPITATTGVLAAVSRGDAGVLYVTLHWPKDESTTGSFALSKGLIDDRRGFQIINLFCDDKESISVDGQALESGVLVSFAPYELKVLKIVPK
ncbi:MAG: beta-galactosidase [bacterium]